MNWIDPLLIGLHAGLTLAGVAIALGISFRLLEFPDLTPEGSVTIGAAAFAVSTAVVHLPPIFAFIAAVLAGSAAGALTAALHVKLHLNKFLAGILVIGICYSLTIRLMGGSNIGLLQELGAAPTPGESAYSEIRALAMLACEVAVIALVITAALASRPGLRLRVAGANPDFATSLGIAVGPNLIMGLAASNGLAALSGAMLASLQGFADVGLGQGMLIIALASIGIGARIITDKRLPLHASVVLGAAMGSVIYQILTAYAVRIGFPASDLRLFTALLVLVMVARRTSQSTSIFPEAVQ